MTFTQSIATCLRKYVGFRGRAQRSEFWWFYLFIVIVGIVAMIIDGVILERGPFTSGPVVMVSAISLMLPFLAATWRRLHDTGRSGWWFGGPCLIFIVLFVIFFVTLVSMYFDVEPSENVLMVVGFIAIILFLLILAWQITLHVLMCLDSQREDNRFGPSPKYGSQSNLFD